MNRIKRTVSLLARRIKKPFVTKKLLETFRGWRDTQNTLPLYQPVQNTLLLIRLDDIGDYILWRNSLHFYKTSPKWKQHHITLLGNKAWKDIFDYADQEAVDDTIWINKNEYLKNESYRFTIWEQLRQKGFQIVICPSNTKPLLLDDLCMLATGAPDTIASENTFPDKQVNAMSDKLYKYIYHDSKSHHEFFFNQDFANWCCDTCYNLNQPQINSSLFHQKDKDYILCYIGASKKSKRIPVATWIDIIRLLKQQYREKILIAGGPAEKEMAEQITAMVQADNITGTVSLADMINYTAFASAVITGNTMEAHLAPSCGTPTVIVANGDNFNRFTAYKEAGIARVETVYAKPFVRAWRRKQFRLFSHYVSVTDDIKTIGSEDILQALQRVYPA